MKAIAIFLTLLVAGISAEPVRFVDTPTQYQRGTIEILLDLVDTIRSLIANYDPAVVDSYRAETTLLDLLTAGVRVEGLTAQGHSRIEIEDAKYDGGVLSLDAVFPHMSVDLTLLHLYVGAASLELGGNLNLRNLGLELVLDIDTSGDSALLTDLQLTLKRPTLSSDLFVRALGNDYSDNVNNFINNRLSDWVDENGHRITDAIVRLVWRIIHSLRDRE